MLEADCGKLKRLITCGVELMKTAYATTKGFDLMRMFKKRTAESEYWARVSHEKSASLKASQYLQYLLCITNQFKGKRDRSIFRNLALSRLAA
jgi:hypothetical protein